LWNLLIDKEVLMKKKYIVRLTDEERAICEAAIKKETGKSERLRRATILLKADANGPAWDDAKICEAVGCRRQTVENVRQAFVLDCFEGALVRKKRATPPTPKLLDGDSEAKLIAMRLGKPPAGYRSQASAKRRPGRAARRTIGLKKSPTCSILATSASIELRWSATT
jgi:hypothetical protein